MTDRLAELRAALMLLTRLPVWPGDAPPPVSRALWAFPLAGLAVGALALLVWQGAQVLDLPPAMAAVLALATMVLATGGLHEDGLADCADGLWGGRDRARRLAIMRDSRIGTYGTLALILSLAIRGAGIVALGAGAGLALLLVSGASRAAPALLLATLPAARADGLGHAASTGAGAGGGAGGAAVAVGIAAACLLPFGLGAALLVGAGMAGLVLGFGRIARSRIGGQTGDVLGAAQQLAEIAGWIVLAALA